MRVARLAFSASVVVFAVAPAHGQGADDRASPIATASVSAPERPSDDMWLAEHLLTDSGRSAQSGFLQCVSESVLRDPRNGLPDLERANPGLTDFVVHRVGEELDRSFAPEWVAARVTLAANLRQYPAAQLTAVRVFFESTTGQKLLNFLDGQFRQALPPFNPAQGIEQCRRNPPSDNGFDALMTDEDRRRFRQFPANPGGQLTPGSALDLAADLGGRSATSFFSAFGDRAGTLAGQASRDFLTDHSQNGAH